MRIWLGICAAVAVGLGGATAASAAEPPVMTTIVPPLPANAKPRPVTITRLSSEIRDQQQVGTARIGVICVEPYPVTWKMLQGGFSNLKAIFGEELQAAGFPTDSKPGDLFAEKEAKSVDLEVGAMIKGADASFCGNLLRASGKLKLDVEWQVYSNLQRQVVARVETHETAQHSKSNGAKDVGRSLQQDAFAANVRALLASDQFRQVVTSAEPAAATAADAASVRSPILVTGAPGRPVAMSDAVGAVASVFAGDGFGSGVLISSDGYMLTDHHVVAGANHVRVRWSDGFETTGEVIRSDKRRDVALIKTDPHGRSPLPIRRGSPPLGATVFAIGTPLDPKLQSTVTRGIVSANRIIDGFSFIQSDVAVNHGNSGGPLLDENGAVIGLTDWGCQPEGDNSHNFFVPVGDALDFLALRLTSGSAAAPAAAPPAMPPRKPKR